MASSSAVPSVESIVRANARRPPFEHQVVGIQELVKWNDPSKGRHIGGCFFLTDEPGAGKTYQVVNAVQVLHDMGEVHRAIVVCQGFARPVWYDPDPNLGEIAKYTWSGLPVRVVQYHQKTTQWKTYVNEAEGESELQWVITNYEFIRRTVREGKVIHHPRLEPILKLCNEKTMLILDESYMVKGHGSDQTQACKALRMACGRVVLMNGTPIARNPQDLFAQSMIMAPAGKMRKGSEILQVRNFTEFKTNHMIMGGFEDKEIVAWRDLDGIKSRMAPYVLRRLKKDCLDLPPRLDPVIYSVPLSKASWTMYKEMRHEFIVWLNENHSSTATQGGTKAIRLAQITSGFLGGLAEEEKPDQEPVPTDAPDWLGDMGQELSDFAKEWNLPEFTAEPSKGDMLVRPGQKEVEIGREKLDFFLDWTAERLQQEEDLKLLVWCRFKPEVLRLYEEVAKRFPEVRLGAVWGGQKKGQRGDAIRLLKPATSPPGPIIVCCTASSGSTSLDFSAAHTSFYLSNGVSRFHKIQSMERVHRPGQVYPVSYYECFATGPFGQKTIDHMIYKAYLEQNDLADKTAAAWLDALKEDDED